MDKQNFRKIDEFTISFDQVNPQTTETVTYTYQYLLDQRDSIQTKKDADNAQREKELEEINYLISQAEGLGISK